MEILVGLGILVGLVAGFFGVGGGALLVPALMSLSYTIQAAIGISIIQMLISSSMGSFLHYKKGNLDLTHIIFLSVGGVLGGLLSPFIVLSFPSLMLELLFIFFVLLAFFKLLYKTKIQLKKSFSSTILILIGLSIGLISSSIGIGGAILLTPFLHVYLGYDLRKATALSLLFILFTTFASSISWLSTGIVLFKEGLIVGLSSLIGVWIGIYLAERVKAKTFKGLLIVLYIVVLIYMLRKVFL
ncbi:sulfite exporter TauE/SafE family protein [Sulfurimonas sp. MAG313]|nr:sulfite exporter TauE/SafE family protein [Sulfurimonas sp. MAG313]MDF1880521.1 sulfite exporter TauE/SafE family protein [Sulfurimonas sp. MAG313]